MLSDNWQAVETVVRFMTGDIERQVPDVAYRYRSYFWLKIHARSGYVK